MSQVIPLKDIALLFLKLGIIGFGGPAAHIAMMQEEVVTKRKWLSEQELLDLIGATNLIPGPNSTELAIHIGREKGGWPGLIVAGLCFILPAVFITGIFAWLYQVYGHVPTVKPFLYGIKPAIIAVVLAAIYPLALKSFKTPFLYTIGTLVLVLSFFGIHELILLFGAGLLALCWKFFQTGKNNTLALLPLMEISLPYHPSPQHLFWIFLKVGATLYGSGYVLFAVLDTELVATGMLSRGQLMDAIAVGQFTPGPVFSSVTFIGYQMDGVSGAVLATVGIFLPSFLFVALLNPLVKMLRSSVLLSHFLDAVNAASVALIVAVCFTMGKESIGDWRSIVIAIGSLFVTFGYRKLNSAWVVAGGAVVGFLLSWL